MTVLRREVRKARKHGKLPCRHGDVLARLAPPTEDEAGALEGAHRGFRPGFRPCSECGGDGRRDPANNDARSCPACMGTGEADDPWNGAP